MVSLTLMLVIATISTSIQQVTESKRQTGEELYLFKNAGSALDSVLQDDRLLASVHDEHHGLHTRFSHILAGE